MSSDDQTIEVRGTRVPRLGFGTWLITGPDATEAVRDALEIGYRQIDTARGYENEREVGRGIADSGVPQDEIARVPGDPTLSRIGERHGKTAGQVALRWLLDQPGVSPIPKASSHERRVENFDVLDFELSDHERREIDGLPKDVRTANPPWAPDWDA